MVALVLITITVFGGGHLGYRILVWGLCGLLQRAGLRDILVLPTMAIWSLNLGTLLSVGFDRIEREVGVTEVTVLK
ncbi:hypothetical protein G9A89_000283 [Geosiphon pyriformis]|nr:hypothetical protein G9A89_000283 [Geosiphon pyriformis]